MNITDLLQPIKDRLAAQPAYEYGCQIGGIIYPHNNEADARRDARFEGNSKRIALRRLKPGRWESVDLPESSDQARLIAAIEAVEELCVLAETNVDGTPRTAANSIQPDAIRTFITSALREEA